MATLLSRIFPNDIANNIYKIAIIKYIQEKIAIYTYNLYLIAEKHLNIKYENGSSLDLIILLNSDINQAIRILTIINKNFIEPYVKFGVNYSEDFKIIFNRWIEYLNKLLINNVFDNRIAVYDFILHLRKQIIILDSLIK